MVVTEQVEICKKTSWVQVRCCSKPRGGGNIDIVINTGMEMLGLILWSVLGVQRTVEQQLY